MTFLSKKFYSMLISGTLTMVVVTLLLISDTVIAGFFIVPFRVCGNGQRRKEHQQGQEKGNDLLAFHGFSSAPFDF